MEEESHNQGGDAEKKDQSSMTKRIGQMDVRAVAVETSILFWAFFHIDLPVQVCRMNHTPPTQQSWSSTLLKSVCRSGQYRNTSDQDRHQRRVSTCSSIWTGLWPPRGLSCNVTLTLTRQKHLKELQAGQQLVTRPPSAGRSGSQTRM